MTMVDIGAGQSGVLLPQRTLWQATNQANTTGGTTATVVVATTPNIGDLMVATAGFHRATTNISTITPTDTGSGGWTSVAPITTVGANGSQMWTKQATSADHNSGSGINVTFTAAGGTGAFSDNVGSVDNFNTGQDTAYTYTVETVASGSTSSVSTIAITGAGDSSGFTDELAYAALYMSGATGGLTGTNQFTGTKTVAFTNSAADSNTFLTRQWCPNTGGGLATVAPSSAAATNTWTMTWTTAHFPIMTGIAVGWTA